MLECKTTSEYRRDDWTEDTVPENYVIQLQHYMAVLGFQYGYLAVLIGGNKFRYFRVERDDELIQNLIRIEQEFWEEHVVKGVPPAWDGSPAANQVLNKLFPGGMVESIELPACADELITQYESACQLLKHAEYQKDEAANKLKALLGDYELGFYGKRRISWKTIAKKVFDSKAFREDYPDLYEQYQHDISYRRFNIK